MSKRGQAGPGPIVNDGRQRPEDDCPPFAVEDARPTPELGTFGYRPNLDPGRFFRDGGFPTFDFAILVPSERKPDDVRRP